ncbi:MetQ/NlpA family ABC transporter substrate-binding protein [Haloactinospora alba]|uniref:MetQ/NlpA family ABC transporter substrate-binding protein n=1 Tax=Haloactinospora alba TaxID=405555 RepID=UPI0011540E68|nr:MetQ/NlpA family ABC transporter substrate-binding protein [Haloactinospora alba]
MRTIWAIAGAAGLVVSLVACGSPSEQASSDGSADGDSTTVTVGATPVPQAQILEFVRDELAADAGLDLEIVEFTDYNQPNTALTEGELDANYFQHKPFLEEYLDGNPEADLSYVGNVHLEAFGLYSEELEKVSGLEEGDKVAVPNDGSNMGRALKLLEDQDLITLEDGAGDTASKKDIAENPRDLQITPVEAAQLPRSLPDVDAAVINGNFALEASIPAEANTLAQENTEDNPYANGLVVPASDTDAPAVTELNELLHSDEVKDYMQEQWDGVVIPLGGEN